MLLGNARLSQELETLKRRSNEQVRDLREEVQQKNNSIAGLEQVLQEMNVESSAAKQQVTQMIPPRWKFSAKVLTSVVCLVVSDLGASTAADDCNQRRRVFGSQPTEGGSGCDGSAAIRPKQGRLFVLLVVLLLKLGRHL